MPKAKIILEKEALIRLLNGLRDRGAVITIKITDTSLKSNDEHLVSSKLRTEFIRVVNDMAK